METQANAPQGKGFFSRIDNISNTRLAFWTIVIGTVLAIILPAILSQLYWKIWGESGINFHETGQVGDTIGGVAGPILNFVGLLVVYFSLREQLKSSADQNSNFNREYTRSANEHVIGTSFNIIDDLRGEIKDLRADSEIEDANNFQYMQGHFDLKVIKPIMDRSIERGFLYINQPKLTYEAAAGQFVASGRAVDLRNSAEKYFGIIENKLGRLVSLLEIFTYLIQNSKLPDEQKALLYTIVQPMVSNYFEEVLKINFVFSDENQFIGIMRSKISIINAAIVAAVKNR